MGSLTPQKMSSVLRRFSRSPYSKVLALLYLTLALVLAGALALRAVTQQSLYSAVWETIAGAAGSFSTPLCHTVAGGVYKCYTWWCT